LRLSCSEKSVYGPNFSLTMPYRRFTKSSMISDYMEH
jgi:hypothetical protein